MQILLGPQHNGFKCYQNKKEESTMLILNIYLGLGYVQNLYSNEQLIWLIHG